MKRTIIVTIMSAALAVLAACGNQSSAVKATGPDPELNKDIKLMSASTPEEINQAIAAVMIRNMEKQLDQMKDQCKSTAGGEPMPQATDAATTTAASFTDTNVQEAGVDESDLIKSDGKYVYALSQGALQVTQVWPTAAFKSVGVLALKGIPQRMILEGSTLVVFSWVYSATKMGASNQDVFYCYVAPMDTQIAVIDVKDPTKPKIIRETVFTGQLVSERRVGSQVYAILNSYLSGINEKEYVHYIHYKEWPKCDAAGEPTGSTEWNAKIEAIKEKNRAIIVAHDFSKQFPPVPEGASVRYYGNADADNLSVMQLLTFSTDTPSQPGDIMMVLGGAGTVYASEKSLYVADLNYSSGAETTTIHHFKLGPQTSYTGSGEVSGHLLNQFSMSEYENVLRVATTTGQVTNNGNSTLESTVYTLDATSPELSELGKITGLGKGETIYAVRFIGPRGFVVTFKKIDPLFVLNLRDPKNPSVMGELKVPGFSSYLHPLDDTHLIGLGKDAEDVGAFAWFQGLKLSLFDVSESTAPTEAQSLIIGGRGSDSEALVDHHAFTFDASRKLLALPVTIYEPSEKGGSAWGKFQYRGLNLYSVSVEKGFELLGVVKLDNADQIRRSILIGDAQESALITLHKQGLSLHKLDSHLSTIGSISWAGATSAQQIILN